MKTPTRLLLTLGAFVMYLGCAVPEEEIVEKEPTCTSHSECGDGLVCISESCEAAFPRTYFVTAESAAFTETKLGGDPWDIDGSAPDGYVKMSVQENECDTTVVEDSVEPEFLEACEFEIFETSAIELRLLDDDLDIPDQAGGWKFSSAQILSALKGGAVTQENDQSSITFSVTLK